jgi:hypothetical protein
VASAGDRALERWDVTVAVVAALFLGQAAIRFASHLAPDVAWYLYAGGRLLDGGVLYKDVVEANPPLGIWLSVLVVALARATAVGSPLVLKLALLLLTALSVSLSARFIAAASDMSTGAKHFILILIAALLLFLPGADFGQRDHVLVLLVSPWVLLKWNRFIGGKVPFGTAALAGLLAATGFWLKPHFIFAFLAVELSLSMATRSVRGMVRIETLAVVAFGAVYLVAVSRLFPRDLVEMSSMSTKAFIPLYGQSAEAVTLRLILPSVLAILSVAATQLLSPQLQLLRALLLAAGGAFLFVFIVQAGYPHQLMPATFFLALAAGIGVAEAFAGHVGFRGVVRRLMAAGSAIAVAAVFVAAAPTQFVQYRGAPFERAIAAEAPNTRSIFIASTSSSHPFPLVEEQGFVWASRFPSQWLLPFAVTTLDESGVPTDGFGKFALDATVSDLIDFAPDIVFIDERPEQPDFRGRPLAYVDFWNKDVRFPQAWKAYERRGDADGFGVYVRHDRAAKQ